MNAMLILLRRGARLAGLAATAVLVGLLWLACEGGDGSSGANEYTLPCDSNERCQCPVSLADRDLCWWWSHSEIKSTLVDDLDVQDEDVWGCRGSDLATPCCYEAFCDAGECKLQENPTDERCPGPDFACREVRFAGQDRPVYLCDKVCPYKCMACRPADDIAGVSIYVPDPQKFDPTAAALAQEHPNECQQGCSLAGTVLEDCDLAALQRFLDGDPGQPALPDGCGVPGAEDADLIDPDLVVHACDDANPCTSDTCSVTGEACTTTPLPDGTVCDVDPEADEVCIQGECTPRDCPSDYDPCTVPVRNPDGTCSEEPAPDGTPCADGEGVCQDGRCVVDDSDCTVECGADADCTPCQPSNRCLGRLSCQDGACRRIEGSAVFCPRTPVACASQVCVPESGVCVFPGEETLCPTVDPCTEDGHCDGRGHCAPGAPIACGSAADCAECVAAEPCDEPATCDEGLCTPHPYTGPIIDGCVRHTCDEATGKRSIEYLPDDTSCNADDDPQTHPDTCQDGVCVPGPKEPCDDDRFEPNDDPAAAPVLGDGTWTGLRACPRSPDYYAVDLGPNGALTVDVGPEAARPVLGWDVLDAAGDPVGSPAAPTYQATAAERVWVRVWLPAYAEVGVDYELTLTVVTPEPPCRDDGWENNDGPAAASRVGEGVFTALQSCPGDPDVYTLPLEVGDTLVVTLAAAAGEGDVRYTVRDADGWLVPLGAGGHVARTAGPYFVWVWLAADTGTSPGCGYTLGLEVVPAPSCRDDGFEPNDWLGAAAWVFDGTYDGLRLCPGDDDWFVVSVPAGADLTVTVDGFQQAEGDVDLALVSGDGRTLGVSITTGNSEVVSVEGLAAGAYGIRVYLYGDRGEAVYRLTVDVEPGTPPACEDDRLEDNDSARAARFLASGSFPALHACPDDEDWYRFSARAGARIAATLDTFDNDDGDIDVVLVAPDGRVVDSSRSVGDAEVVAVTADRNGTYALRVWLYGESDATPGNDYDLELDVGVPPDCEDADPLEPNDDPDHAPRIEAGTFDGLRLCRPDSGFAEDWSALHLDAGESVTVALDFAHADGDIDLQLQTPDGGVVASSTSITDHEEVTYTAVTSGTFLVRAWLYADIGATVGAGYEMTVAVAPPAQPCGDDLYEQNDTRAEAALVPAPQLVTGLTVCFRDADWYAVAVEAGQTLSVSLSQFSNADGDIDVRLLSPDGAVVDASTSTADHEEVQAVAPRSGLYRVHVSLFDDPDRGGNTYALDVSLDPEEPACVDDAFEPNDEAGSAGPPLAPGTHDDLWLCPDEDDVYQVHVDAGQRLTVTADFSHAQGDVDLLLLSADGAVLDRSQGVGDHEELVFPAGDGAAALSATYLVRAWLWGGADARTSYELGVSLDPPAPPCEDDGAEPNDAPSEAAPVDPIAPVSGVLCPGDEDDFRVDLAEGDALRADVTTATAAPVFLVLLDPAGRAVRAVVSGGPQPQALDYPATTAGAHTVRVWRPLDDTVTGPVDYTLGLAVTPE